RRAALSGYLRPPFFQFRFPNLPGAGGCATNPLGASRAGFRAATGRERPPPQPLPDGRGSEGALARRTLGAANVRTVITGGAGFIGSHLCERFLARGHVVVCVDNLITGAEDNVAHLRADPRFTFVRHDVSRRLEIDGPVDNVLHFASPASPVDYLTYPI